MVLHLHEGCGTRKEFSTVEEKRRGAASPCQCDVFHPLARKKAKGWGRSPEAARENALIAFGNQQAEIAQVVAGGAGYNGVAESVEQDRKSVV